MRNIFSCDSTKRELRAKILTRTPALHKFHTSMIKHTSLKRNWIIQKTLQEEGPWRQWSPVPQTVQKRVLDAILPYKIHCVSLLICILPRFQEESYSREDEWGLSHCTSSIVATSKPFWNWGYKSNSQFINCHKMSFCERVGPHKRVHSWCNKYWFFIVPGSDDACQQVVT